jgi:hypothetical protein
MELKFTLHRLCRTSCHSIASSAGVIQPHTFRVSTIDTVQQLDLFLNHDLICRSAEKKDQLRKAKVRLRAPSLYLGMNVLQLYDTTADDLSNRYSNHVRPTESHYRRT